MKKVFSIIILALLITGAARAQDNLKAAAGFAPSSYYTFSWNTAFTTGDFNKWVGNGSPAGFDFGGRYFVRKGLAVGYNISWQRIGQIYSDQTFTIPDKGIAITAENYRLTWMVPFQAAAAYHFIPDKMVSPYVGLGIGGDYMEHHLLIQEYDIYKTRWDFSLTPEVGALLKFGYYGNWGALVALNYKWTTNQIEIYETTSNNLQMINLKVGMVLIVR